MSNGIRQSVHRQLRALKATVASCIAQIEALEETVGVSMAPREPVPPQPASPCAHPEDSRKALATFDSPGRFICRKCGEVVEPQTEAKELTHGG